MEQRPCQRKPLALPARKVRGIFHKERVKAALGFQKSCQVRPFQYRPELPVRRIRLSHQKILPHGAFEQIALMADIGDVLHQFRFPYV